MGLPARSDKLPEEYSPRLRLIAPVPASPTRREMAARRARRVVCWTLFSIVLLQAGLAIFFFRHPGRTDPDYWTRLGRIRQRTGPAAENPFTVFVLGSSRTQLGLLCGQLEKSLTDTLQRPVVAISFSGPGSGPLQELLVWRRLQRDGFRPDLLLVEIHPSLLNADHPPGWGMNQEPWPLARLSWSDLDFMEKYAGEVRPGIRRDWLYSAINPLYHFRINLVSETAPDLLPLPFRLASKGLDPSGQIVTEDLPNGPEDLARGLAIAQKSYQSGLQSFRPGPAEANLRELLAASRADGVPAAMLLMPEGPVFRSWYGPGVWQSVEKCLDDVVAECTTPMLNVHTWLREDEFQDSHHLTRAAAVRFSDRLAREKLTPLVRNLLSQRNNPVATR